jgi:hypothetical protein
LQFESETRPAIQPRGGTLFHAMRRFAKGAVFRGLHSGAKSFEIVVRLWTAILFMETPKGDHATMFSP